MSSFIAESLSRVKPSPTIAVTRGGRPSDWRAARGSGVGG